MGADVFATIAEVFSLTVATSPSQSGLTVTLTALYSIDGVNTGTDNVSALLVFPVTMNEGLPGVYSTDIVIHGSGVYWARIDIGGTEQVVIVRVQSLGFPQADTKTDLATTIALVAHTSPSSITITINDSDGVIAGNKLDGTAYAWPQAMTVVPGHSDSWYFTSLTFSEGGRMQMAFSPDVGPIFNDVIFVFQSVQAVALTHFSGFEPDAGFVPSSWVSVSYIQRWAGWKNVDVEIVKELRRTAIESFIEETNMWVPGWVGTWHQLRAQGSRLYLPVPIILPSQGGIEPCVEYTHREGGQAVIATLSNSTLVFKVGGRNSKQPYIEIHRSLWDHTIDVKVRATWGMIGVDSSPPIKLKQVLVGLMRWHALSLGVDSDDARDQSTLNRIKAEGTRDSRAQYDDRAIGDGLTGDRTVDRVLAEYTIQPGPWISRGGALPHNFGRF